MQPDPLGDKRQRRNLGSKLNISSRPYMKRSHVLTLFFLLLIFSSLQLVWATTSRVGCAVYTCPRMNVWGEIWENAIYLVCNYSPK